MPAQPLAINAQLQVPAQPATLTAPESNTFITAPLHFATALVQQEPIKLEFHVSLATSAVLHV
jgi:hypothetical protein